MVSRNVLHRITVAPKGSFFLFGAREVGKSTWARRTFNPEGIEVWPCPKFLAALQEGTLWP